MVFSHFNLYSYHFKYNAPSNLNLVNASEGGLFFFNSCKCDHGPYLQKNYKTTRRCMINLLFHIHTRVIMAQIGILKRH